MQDLNVNPKLPFDDCTFDVITNVVRNLVFHLEMASDEQN